MRAIDMRSVTWRRSSYSNTSGGECVEVSDDFLRAAGWRKSSRSNTTGGDCVEVSDDFLDADRRRSSYSNSDGGQCLEVADNLPSVVPVRDSKAPARAALVFGAATWVAFVAGVKHEHPLG
ncbi:DUF397 domain-containing protein [Streptomyces sp. NPDC100445]|uniref:DUF397 domain-containing protein n=1 Tax=Streptomyces sp. NPDC100445 TaxID=3366102 RepID=UPI0037FC662C